MVPVKLPITFPQTPDSLAPCCTSVLSGEGVKLEVHTHTEQLALKSVNHSCKHKLSNIFVYLPALISFIANSSNFVSLKSPFAARDCRSKIIIHVMGDSFIRGQTCVCKEDTDQPVELLVSPF